MTRTGRWGAALAGALCVVVSVGCQDQQAGYPPASPAPDPIVGGYPQITMAGGLSRLIVHGAPVVEGASASAPMRVTVPVRSIQDAMTRVQYQYTWLDDKGRPVSESGWRYETVPPRMERFFESSALSTKAVGWRLEIKVAT